MAELSLWHNPGCSKSRQALALLQERGVTPEIRLYLQDPPSEAELADALGRLGLTAEGLIRVADAEPEALEAARAGGEQGLIAWLAQNPRLIQRPVALRGERAVIGRPPEKVLALLDEAG